MGVKVLCGGQGVMRWCGGGVVCGLVEVNAG